VVRILCDECGQSPCHPRCPNAPEPTAVYVCKSCGAEIHEGEYYYVVGGEPYCDDCVSNDIAYAEDDCDDYD